MAIDVLTLGAAIGALKGKGGGTGVTNGYYYNGAFYKDAQHTELIEPKEGGLYYDVDNGALYVYNGTEYDPIANNVKVFDAETALYDDVYDATVNRGMLVFVLYKYISSYAYKTALVAKYSTNSSGDARLYLVSPEIHNPYQRIASYSGKTLYTARIKGTTYSVTKDSDTGKIVLTAQELGSSFNGQPEWTAVTSFTEFIDSYDYTSLAGGVKVPHMLLAKAMNDRINALQNLGRYLALWNASTGVPTSEPLTSPYAYRSGDYFRVGTSGNRVPTGSSYTIGGTNYETVTETINVGDVYYYDGTVWKRQPTSGEVAWGEIQGDITDQTDLASYLSAVLTAIQGVQLNGTDLTPDTNKKVNIPLGTNQVFGIVKGAPTYGTAISNGLIIGEPRTLAQYISAAANLLVAKSTLEAVLDAETVRSDKAQSLTTAQKTQARDNIGAGTPVTQATVDGFIKSSVDYLPFGYMTASGETGTIKFYTEITPDAT